jgi:UDPglucose--hexose-1-phosphate uridylyltransferase
MSELRQNLVTKEWYVIATGRARRPDDFVRRKPRPHLPRRSSRCPFCAGNESLTPPEVGRVPADGRWQVRVVPNKFSAFSAEGRAERHVDGLYRWANGVGVHEVIVETPRHDLIPAQMSLEQLRLIMRMCQERFASALEDPRVSLVILFKNYGEAAGTSLLHPHSQLMATPLVPTHISYRVEEARRYYDEVGRCVFCDTLSIEAGEKERVVWENDGFLVFSPYACGAPYEVWIMPKRHTSCFSMTTQAELDSLAEALFVVHRKMHALLGDPDFNYVLRVTPKDERYGHAFHWYIKYMPRLAKQAGFELGTGMYVNTTLPEDNAKYLREVKVPVS